MREAKHIYACDFETTVYDDQDRTDVWSSCFCELGDHKPIILGNIADTYKYFVDLNANVDLYYHNLKFDGNFWLYFLIHDLNLRQAYIQDNEVHVTWMDDDDMPYNSFKYLISRMGQWYTITIRTNKGKYIRMKDSLKLLPFKLAEIADAFKTEHKKLDMEYKGFRYPNCPISEEERAYIENDVYVLKEALEMFFKDNPQKLTIGACCLARYKKDMMGEAEDFFKPMTEVKVPFDCPYETAEQYIRKSYRGGWCYVVPEKANQVFTDGLTADVNSLYPSVMSGESGNMYPVGNPCFWQGDIPEEVIRKGYFYFVRIKTRFYLKENYLPFIQIKGTIKYKGNEVLESSDYYDRKQKKYFTHYYEKGVLCDTRVELVLTMMDFALLKEHYDLVEFEVLDGCYFQCMTGEYLFDAYINTYRKQKMESKGAKRTEAKLFLNNLYGKFATSTDSTFKVAYYNEEQDKISFWDCVENNKKPFYIPIGSAITSYARNFTIRTAQKNYYGKHERGFIYADTDSIHCDLKPEELKGVPVDANKFLHWKLESYWDKAIFARQKTYIEHVTHHDGEPIDAPYYDIKCAGMPQQCKALLDNSLKHVTEAEIEELERERKKPYNDEEKRFMLQPRELTDFKFGLTIPSKLIPKRISGGVLLTETTYCMIDPF